MTKKPTLPLRKRPVKTQIAIRFADHILASLDKLAIERGQNRSALIQEAVAVWLAAQRKEGR